MKSYSKSLALLQQVENLVPGASQTFSKSSLLYPRGHSPHVLERGQGSRAWDVDGNEYVDIIAGLLAILLGYCDAEVDHAITEQLKKGISFSLSTRLEAELAEQIIDILPSAEMVRFAKNGSDVTSAAVRIARAATGRERIIITGYHGWHDWYVGSTSRDRGVPGATSQLTHAVAFNDLDAMQQVIAQYPGEIAAIVMEPVYAEQPDAGYLQAARELCNKNGIVLVFDEIITGFRVHLGGAQSHYDVTPDLTCLGKALGNGMPVAVLTGSRSLMQEFEKVFVSGTFAGETLSLAAALAVIEKLRAEPVIASLWRNGEFMKSGMDEILRRHGLASSIHLRGLPPMQSLQFTPSEHASAAEIQTLLVIQMLERGVLTMGALNQMYAHDDADLAHVLSALDESCAVIKHEIQSPGLEARLACPLIQPVFQVRKS